MIQPNDIVSSLVPDQIVRVTSVRPMGSSYAIGGSGFTDERVINVIKSEEELQQMVLVYVHDQLTFAGGPVKFMLWIEAKCIQATFQFSPLFAENCRIVDPLPYLGEALFCCLRPFLSLNFSSRFF